MNKYRIENPNNNKVREYKSRTTDNIYKEFRWYVSFLLNCGKVLD